MSSYLQRHAFLRLLCPLMIGIVCGDAYPYVLSLTYYGVLALLGVSALFVCYGCRRPHLFSLVLWLLLGSFGYFHASECWKETELSVADEAGIYKVRLLDVPEAKERSFSCRATLLESYRGDSVESNRGDGFLLLYFPKDTLSASLRRGDELLIHTRLAPPRNNGNPDEFDYERFLRRRGGAGTSYVPSNSWQRSGHHEHHSLRQDALDCRERVIALYRNLGFTGDELAVLQALTLGDKNDLSEEIVETYSVSGASHVLALSGLHVGFLYALLWFLVAPLWRWKGWLKLPLLLAIVLLMWGFAFLTGLSPSVVRSVLMVSIVAIGTLQYEKALTMNVMAAAAFLMLIINPLWLFDVGFQLSFSAVAAILLIQPALSSLWKPKNRLAGYVWDLMTVSVAAQIGTSPWVIFYFSRFSTHFLLTNLWVIPMVSLVLYASVLLLMLTPFPTLQYAFAPVVRWLIDAQNEGLRLIESFPYSSIDNIRLDRWEVLGLFLLLAAAGYCWRRFSFSRLILLLCLTGALTCYRMVLTYRNAPTRSVVFYNLRRSPAVHCIAPDGSSWLVGTDTLPDLKPFRRSLTPYWNRLQLATPLPVAEGYSHEQLSVEHRMLSFAGKRICLLYDDYWRHKQAKEPLPVDYLYVSRGYKGGIEELSTLFAIGTVVLDSSLSAFYRERIREDCTRLEIPCYDLSECGSRQFSL